MSNLCNTCNLDTSSNEIEVLIRQLRREVEELMKSTTARLLLQDSKIADTCVYIKENLSGEIRNLLDTMLATGELDQIITDTVIYSLGILKSMFINVKEYGAKGDGVTDDSRAIQLTIDENPDKTIFIPDGTYRICEPIRVNTQQKLTGISMNDTILKYDLKDGNLIDIQGNSHIDIENMSLIHSFEIEQVGAPNTAKAINGISSPYTRYKNLIIKGFDYAIDCGINSWCVDLDNVSVQSCNYGLSANGEFNNCSISKLRATYCDNGAFIGSGRTVSIKDSQFELNNIGIIKTNLGDVEFANCYFERNKKDIDSRVGNSAPYKISINDCSFFKNEQNVNDEPGAIKIHGLEDTLVVIKHCSFTKYNLDTYAILDGVSGTKAKVILEDNYIGDGITKVKPGFEFSNLVDRDSFVMNEASVSFKHSHTPKFVAPNSNNQVLLDGLNDSYRTYSANDVTIILPKDNNSNSYDLLVTLDVGKSVTVLKHPESNDVLNNADTYTNNTGVRQYLAGKVYLLSSRNGINEYSLVWFNGV